jgi:hypothetical protein
MHPHFPSLLIYVQRKSAMYVTTGGERGRTSQAKPADARMIEASDLWPSAGRKYLATIGEKTWPCTRGRG